MAATPEQQRRYQYGMRHALRQLRRAHPDEYAEALEEGLAQWDRENVPITEWAKK